MNRLHLEHVSVLPSMAHYAIGECLRWGEAVQFLILLFDAATQQTHRDYRMTCDIRTRKGRLWVWTIKPLRTPQP